MRFRKSVVAILAVFALIGAFETIVRVKPAYGQAVGYCGFGRPCSVSRLTVPTNGRLCLNSACTVYWYFDGTNTYLIGSNGINLSGAWFAQSVIVGNGSGAISTNGAATLDLSSSNPDSASGIGVKIRSGVAFSTSGAKIASFQNSTTEKAVLDLNGIFSSVGTLAGTSGSGTGITVNATGELRHYIHKITVARTALTAAATTQDITLWTVPDKTRIVRILDDVTQAFDDGAGPISAVTTSCGNAAGGTQYLLANSAFAVAVMGNETAEIGATLLSATYNDVVSWGSTGTITCRWTATGGNLNTLTTGSSTFYIEAVTYP